MYACKKCKNEKCNLTYIPVGMILSQKEALIPEVKNYINSENGRMVKKEFLLCSCGICTYQFIRNVETPEEEINFEKMEAELKDLEQDLKKNIEIEVNKIAVSISNNIESFHKKYKDFFNIKS